MKVNRKTVAKRMKAMGIEGISPRRFAPVTTIQSTKSSHLPDLVKRLFDAGKLNHVRLLSGLYGVLRPLDLMQPYRLEMGTPFANSRGKNLYEFWGGKIADNLNQTLAETGSDTLVNLASQEYFKAVDTKKLNAKIITPVFKDEKNGQYKIISFYAKRARGLMVRYAAEHAVTEPEQLKNFDYEGYAFNAAASNENEWVFLRKEQTK